MKYPNCQYVEDISAALCCLDILFTNSFDDVISMKEWEDNVCTSLLDDCICDYCVGDNNNDNSSDNNNNKWVEWNSDTFIVGIIIGCIGGIFLTLLIVKLWICYRQREENKSLWYADERELSNYKTYTQEM